MKRKIAKLVINTIRSNCIFLVLFLVVILISFISYHSYYPDDNIPDSSLANFMDPNSDECKFNSSQYFNYSLRNFGKHFTVDATGTLPWVSGSNFLLLSDLVYDKPNKDEREMNYFIDTVKTSIDTMKNGQVIFIRGLWLNVDFFFENYYAKIKTKFILITHNSDNEPKEKYKKYLDDAKFIAWFAANVDFSHPKHIAIPLGFENTFWFPPKVKYIRRICSEKQLIPWEKRKHLMYVNINPYTNSKARSYLNGYFKNFKGALINNYRVNYTKFMNIIGNSKYVLCPRGNGLDTHRFYESLLMGAIPIVENSTLWPIFKQTTTLVVSSFKHVNMRMLRNPSRYIQDMSFSRKILYQETWTKIIENYRLNAAS